MIAVCIPIIKSYFLPVNFFPVLCVCVCVGGLGVKYMYMSLTLTCGSEKAGKVKITNMKKKVNYQN